MKMRIPTFFPIEHGYVLQLSNHTLVNAQHENEQPSGILVSDSGGLGFVRCLGIVSLVDGKKFSPSTGNESLAAIALPDLEI